MRRNVWLGIAAAVWLLAGCGGGGGSSSGAGTGRAVFRVVWPKSDRVIPTLTQSIQIVVNSGATEVGRLVLNKPTPPATDVSGSLTLPTGNLVASVIAFDQQKIALAQKANIPITIQSNASTPVTIDLDSTITSVKVIPSPFMDPFVLYAGQPYQVYALAYDAAQNFVPTDPADITFASSDSSIAKVFSDGEIQPFKVGTVNITATEKFSGKVGTVPLNVVVKVQITPSPALETTLNATEQFSATVAGTSNAAVTWSVLGTGSGTIDATGLYTAPGTPGVYTVVATSVFDPNQKDQVLVPVKAGSGVVVIQ